MVTERTRLDIRALELEMRVTLDALPAKSDLRSDLTAAWRALGKAHDAYERAMIIADA
jgi:hypothetical protein